jgi:hypothetical protein
MNISHPGKNVYPISVTLRLGRDGKFVFLRFRSPHEFQAAGMAVAQALNNRPRTNQDEEVGCASDLNSLKCPISLHRPGDEYSKE